MIFPNTNCNGWKTEGNQFDKQTREMIFPPFFESIFMAEISMGWSFQNYSLPFCSDMI